MSDTSHDHEIVSIYGYSEAQINKIMEDVNAGKGALVVTEAADWSDTSCPPTYIGSQSLEGSVVLVIAPTMACTRGVAAGARLARLAPAWRPAAAT